MWTVEHEPFRHSTMRSGSSSSSSRFKIRPQQVNASTCDFDRCCLQSGDNTGTHLLGASGLRLEGWSHENLWNRYAHAQRLICTDPNLRQADSLYSWLRM